MPLSARRPVVTPVRARTIKQKVTRKREERTHPMCIQRQLYRGHITPVNAWSAIRYGYKSPLLFIHGSGKPGAPTQCDYLVQVLETQLNLILEAFAAITHLLRSVAELLFIEDGNSAHCHKSTRNCYAKWHTAHSIILMQRPSTSPDMNPIEKC